MPGHGLAAGVMVGPMVRIGSLAFLVMATGTRPATNASRPARALCTTRRPGQAVPLCTISGPGRQNPVPGFHASACLMAFSATCVIATY
jgi:hypothetical protein